MKYPHLLSFNNCKSQYECIRCDYTISEIAIMGRSTVIPWDGIPSIADQENIFKIPSCRAPAKQLTAPLEAVKEHTK
jgi:hypothetical protein